VWVDEWPFVAPSSRAGHLATVRWHTVGTGRRVVVNRLTGWRVVCAGLTGLFERSRADALATLASSKAKTDRTIVRIMEPVTVA